MHSLTFVALEQRGSYRSARCAFIAQEWQKDLGGPEMEAIVVTTFTNWVRRRQRHWHSWKERKSWEPMKEIRRRQNGSGWQVMLVSAGKLRTC